MADFHFGIQRRQAADRVGHRPARLHQPVAERTKRLEVMVVSLRSQVFLLAEAVQEIPHHFGLDVTECPEFALRDNPLHAAHRQLDMLGRRLADAALEGVEVTGQRHLPLGCHPFRLRIN
ncbi:MAG: hypothetical protein SFU86_15935 [Pirellulaceae bacterium]|nr:hypothetical protein [Pirellulaceae bacterium]